MPVMSERARNLGTENAFVVLAEASTNEPNRSVFVSSIRSMENGSRARPNCIEETKTWGS